MIKDTANRTEFETGAKRDITNGKGRFDLIPIKELATFTDDPIFDNIAQFKYTGNVAWLYSALNYFRVYFTSEYLMVYEVSKHFEEGALKYGENNWQKGIPISSYIDSALRHYTKYKLNYQDENHDRAFIWNILCAIWTMNNKANELDNYTFRKDDSDVLPY